MALNNINLAAYDFNPFGNLSNGLMNGYNMAQNAALNKLKAQMMQQQIQQMPINNNLKQEQTLSDAAKTESGIRLGMSMGLIQPNEGQKMLNRLNSQDNNRQASTNNLNDISRNMTSQQKNALTSLTGNLSPRIGVQEMYGNNNWMPNTYSQLNNDISNVANKIPDTQTANTAMDNKENIKNVFTKGIEKSITPTTTQQQIDYSTGFHSIMNTITPEMYEAMYNPENRLKYHIYDISHFIDPNLTPPEGYDDYQRMLATLKNLKTQYTKSVRGSVGTNAQKSLDSLLNPGLFSNPQKGKDRLQSLADQLDLEVKTLQKNVNTPFSKESVMPDSYSNLKSLNSFKTTDDIKKYYVSLSPEQRIKFKEKYGE